MNRDIIEKTEAFLREKLEGGAFLSGRPDALEYRLQHSYRVANIGRSIARGEGFDETEMTAACLLHDVAYCEDFGETGWREHGRRSAQIARPFLEGLGLPAERVNDMLYGIAIHVDDEADFDGEKTAFALSIGDADNIDRFDAYRIHEGLSCEGFIGMAFDEKLAFVEKRLSRLGELYDMPVATKTAEALWRERISFYTSFYERLREQLKNSLAIAD